MTDHTALPNIWPALRSEGLLAQFATTIIEHAYATTTVLTIVAVVVVYSGIAVAGWVAWRHRSEYDAVYSAQLRAYLIGSSIAMFLGAAAYAACRLCAAAACTRTACDSAGAGGPSGVDACLGLWTGPATQAPPQATGWAGLVVVAWFVLAVVMIMFAGSLPLRQVLAVVRRDGLFDKMMRALGEHGVSDETLQKVGRDVLTDDHDAALEKVRHAAREDERRLQAMARPAVPLAVATTALSMLTLAWADHRAPASGVLGRSMLLMFAAVIAIGLLVALDRRGRIPEAGPNLTTTARRTDYNLSPITMRGNGK